MKESELIIDDFTFTDAFNSENCIILQKKIIKHLKTECYQFFCGFIIYACWMKGSELIIKDFTFTEAFNLVLFHFTKKIHQTSKNKVLPVLMWLYHVCLLDEGI